MSGQRQHEALLALKAVLFTALPSLASAYSWQFTDTPEQCQNLSLQVTGSGGSPPYRALIMPFGPTTLPNDVEARRIMDLPFDNDTSLTFQLNYPVNSQFVVVISDSTGFGSGGTSVAGTVLKGSDDSCFDSNTNVQPKWFFAQDPDGALIQCSSTRLWWNATDPAGLPSFHGIIPGGESFTVPQPSNDTKPSEGTGFSWTPSIRGGTNVLLVAGDDNGIGTGGSATFTVSTGSGNSQGCLNSTSPSSTPGSPAGGSYPTSTSGAGTGGSQTNPNDPNGGSSGGSSHHSSNVGPIVGGVLGGVVGLAALGLLLLFFMRRRRFHQSTKERPVDLLQEHESNDGRPHEVPQYYRPEPFIVPDPTEPSTVGATEAGMLRPSTERGYSRSTTPETSAGGYGAGLAGAASTSQSTRKSAAGPTPLRPVNIIQHDDAGAADPAAGEENRETIELPPAYNRIKSGAV